MNTAQLRNERRAKTRKTARDDILAAAHRVAERDGARNLSLRSVATEAGFVPAALYGYFRNKDELLLALAAEDLSAVAKAMRSAAGAQRIEHRLGTAAAVALGLLAKAETLAAASGALAAGSDGEMERIFNGRLISVLTALSDAAGLSVESRTSQADIVLIAAAVAGLALLERAGRLNALGFAAEEILARLPQLTPIRAS